MLVITVENDPQCLSDYIYNIKVMYLVSVLLVVCIRMSNLTETIWMRNTSETDYDVIKYNHMSAQTGIF